MGLIGLGRRRERLRPLDEAQCYARCYGERDAEIRLLRLEPRRPRYPALATGEVLRASFEERLDRREPDAS